MRIEENIQWQELNRIKYKHLSGKSDIMKNMNHNTYYSSVKRVLIIVLTLNIAVALSKMIYGWWTNSLSMVSDGFHSLFDGASNVIGIIGIIIACRPPDQSSSLWS